MIYKLIFQHKNANENKTKNNDWYSVKPLIKTIF